MDELKHIPVLLDEVINGLEIKDGGYYLDCTLGGAGHASEILKRIPNGFLYGIDQDDYAIKRASDRLSQIGNNYQIIKTNFKNLEKVSEVYSGLFSGILYDLGVSSFQFDEQSRGFSYRFDAKLDMRMDQDSELSAYEVVNDYSVDDLTTIFYKYGEEPFAKKIALEIDKARINKPIETTFELVDIIKKALPSKVLRKSKHPAKQVFQALRIEVNHELDVLEESLNKSLKLLEINGVLAVITFHSLEDRMVKQIFKKVSTLDLPKGLPFIPDGYSVNYEIINHHVITSSQVELEENNRAHSAKLRLIRRIK